MHREWTGRNLYFWFFSFGAGYSRGETSEGLLALFGDMDVRSYSVWEMLGVFDVLACVYLEPSKEGAFEQAARAHLAPLGLTRVHPFVVQDVIRDWVWNAPHSDSGPVRIPDINVLRERFSQRELDLLNEPGDSRERHELVRRYTELGLVTEAQHSYGIELVLLIGSVELPTHQNQRLVGRRLAKVLDQARDLVHDCALFEGRGGQRELFLARCRVDHKDFHRIGVGLIEPIRAATALAEGNVAALTVLSEDAILFQDQVALAAPTVAVDATTLLEAGESQSVDITGTLLSPLDRWLRHDLPLEEMTEHANRAVLAVIVGLLNSGGGNIVIGAIDRERYRLPEVVKRLGNPPSIGGYWVIGLVDPTYVQHGWDRWSKKLRDLLSRIDPDPGVLVEARMERVLDRDVCVIDVYDAGDAAYFLRNGDKGASYYARQGTVLRELSGSMIDEHRGHLRHPRELRSRSR